MNDYSIIVNTCDAYSDLWSPFFYLLKENWPDSANHRILINTETLTDGVSGDNITFVNTKYEGKDLWGGRLLHCLRETTSKYVINIMDDFFLRTPFPQERLQIALDAMEKDSDIACFYLVDIFKKDVEEDAKYPGYAEVPKWKNYRLNSAPAIWRRESLMKYLKETDNPWAWEYFGSCKTNHTNDKFYSAAVFKEPVYDYAHAIYRGKWLGEDVLPLLGKYPLDIDLNVRGLISMTDALPKRNFRWKVKFVMAGIRMVGLEAFRPLLNDLKGKYVSR